MIWKIFQQRYKREHLLNLFFICAFPFHLWTILLVLNDVEWIAQRTDLWDAIGVGTYALLYTLIESIAFFLLIILLGIFLPWHWTGDKVFTQLSYVSLCIPLWAGLNQLYRYNNLASPNFIVEWLFSTGHPLRYGFGAIGLLTIIIIGTTAVPIFLIGLNHQIENKIHSFFHRIVTLSVVYITLDLFSAIILLIRNIN